MLLPQSSGSFVRFRTSATSATITSLNTLYDTYPDLTHMGVRADGVDIGLVEPGALGLHDTSIALPAGDDKVVDIITGPQAGPSGYPLGTWIVDVEFNAASTKLSPAQTPTILVYGDSISVGDGADYAALECWVQLVRNDYTGAIKDEAWGSRSLHQDTSTAAKLSAFVSHIVEIAPDIIWLSIGTNDFGLNKQSAADFEIAYAALLDAVHTALPSAAIYAQTPTIHLDEAFVNAFGDVIADYRTAIANAQSTRAGWCVLVDGTGAGWPLPADLDDSIHPNTAGHAKMATEVKSILGIP